MVPELRYLTYEDKLKEMGLPDLQVRRKKEDLIALCKIVNGFGKLDKQNLAMVKENTKDIISRILGRNCTHERTLKEDQGELIFKEHYSFPHGTLDIWNGTAINIST